MKIIRASEIGTYMFCNRAWWYQLNGYEPENKAELNGGVEVHAHHSNAVLLTRALQIAAYIVLLSAVVTAVVWIIQAGF